MATVKVTDADFNEQVLKGTGPVLVDFWATWCGPCKMMAPVLEEVSNENEGKLKVAKLDVDQNPATASKYGIMSIPTMIVFKDGQPVKQLIGYMPKGHLLSQIADVM